MSPSEQPGLRIYLITALLGNTPTMFFFLFLSFVPSLLVDYLLLIQALLFSLMFSGSAMASYLLVRRFPSRPAVLGLVTGSVSSLINLIYTSFFYREYMVLGGYWPFLAFVSGGVAGALLRQEVQRRKRPSMRKE